MSYNPLVFMGLTAGQTPGGGGGSGTVTSVGLSLPAIFTVTNSPVTTTGTLTGTLTSQTANTVFAAPNGSGGVPTFRLLVAADIPSLSGTYALTNLSNLTSITGQGLNFAPGFTTNSITTQNASSSTNSSNFTITTGSVVNGTAGQINLLGGPASGTGGGSQVIIAAGNAVSGPAGEIQLTAGSVTGNGSSGIININSGNSSGTNVAGLINLTSGNNTSTGDAGNIQINSGNASNSGSGGSLLFNAGSSNSGSAGSILLSTGSSTSGSQGSLLFFTDGNISLNPVNGPAAPQLQFFEGTDAFFASFEASNSLAANVSWILPLTDGSPNQFLQTNGFGQLTFANAPATGANVTLSNLTSPTAINQNLTFAAGAGPFSVVTPNTTGSTASAGLQVLSGNSVNGSSGTVLFSSGDATGSGSAGAATFRGGNAAGAGNGGSVSFMPGSSVSGNPGQIQMFSDNGIVLLPNTLHNPPTLQFFEGTSNFSVSLKASSSLAGNLALTLPIVDGSNGWFLKTNGSGVLAFAAGNAGTVTAVSIATANGFAGSSSGGATPALTITVPSTGVLKSNGTAIGAATSGTDYSAGTSGLTTGILKSTTTTGALTIAVAGDFPTLNQNTTGSAATLTTPRAINGVNFDGSAAITVTAAAGTLTGTTLNSTVVTSSLTSVGTQAAALNMGSHKITSVTDPTSAQDAATKAYVDNATAGINPAVAVQAATIAAANTSGFTYNNGVSGIGATLTSNATNTALTVDGFTFTALNQRLLVKNDTQSPSGAFNGIYFVTQVQALGLPIILTRALDYDQSSDINNTGAIPVINGTVNGTTQWVLTSLVNTVGTDPLTFTQFARNPADYLLKANNLSDVFTKATSFNNISPVTTTGDLIYSSSGATNTRLPIGTSGQVLTVSAGVPTWQPAPGTVSAFFASTQVTTTSSNITSSTFTTFSNSPAFTFTPTITGTYKVYATVPLSVNGASNANGIVRIFNTTGSGTLLYESDAINDGNATTFIPIVSINAQSVYSLTAGTTYVFDIQGKQTVGALGIALDGTDSPFYMFAELEVTGQSPASPFQFFASSQVTTASSVIPGTSFSTFSNSPALSFTPTVTGKYKVYSSIAVEDQSSAGVIVRIFNTTGSASLLNENQGFLSGSGTFEYGSVFIQSIYTLNAGTPYVFDIQGANGSGGSNGQNRGDLAPFCIFSELCG